MSHSYSFAVPKYISNVSDKRDTLSYIQLLIICLYVLLR